MDSFVEGDTLVCDLPSSNPFLLATYNFRLFSVLSLWWQALRSHDRSVDSE